MKRVFLSLVFIAMGMLYSFAQQVGPNISWDNPVYDFGDVKEDGGLIHHKFEFTNTGSQPLVLTNVRPSCGCTTSDYTKAPVPAGGKGFVSVSFDPRRRVGKNSKSVTVTTNAKNKPTTVLRFTVNVLPKPKTLEDDYPRVIGELRFKTNHMAMGKVKMGEIKDGSLDVVNTTDHNVTLSFPRVPKHLEITAVPQTLKPKEKGKIVIKYNSTIKDDYGFVMDRVPVAMNGSTNNNRNTISVSATIEEDFSKLTPEELANAPKISFEEKVFNFGTINQGDVIEHVFKFTNTGKSDLIIRKTKASCGCTVVSPSSKVIKPGETAELKAKFNSRGKKNKQNKTITIITNSPSQPQVILRVTGFVKVPEQK